TPELGASPRQPEGLTMKRLCTLLILGALALLAILPAAYAQVGKRQFYSNWQHIREKNYYMRTYYYKSGPNDFAYRTQYVIYKPSLSKEWVYWYNPETKKFWARCATKNHPMYGADVKKFKDIWGLIPKDSPMPEKTEGLAEAMFGETKAEAPPIPGSMDG